MNVLNKEELIAFEEEIKAIHLTGAIKAPVHFAGGNEDALIEIFRLVSPGDWVFSTHRSHYHALLKGIPREWLKKEILEGRSIGIYNAEYRFFSSAIVGGALPIAVGTAMGARRKQTPEHVWVFGGEMAAETGIFHECAKYAVRNGLPITFVVEDNTWSVNTPTRKVWGEKGEEPDIMVYQYERVYPHQGAGWITFPPSPSKDGSF
jgi:pyruvate dehydrogenase E1 component alpha subunit